MLKRMINILLLMILLLTVLPLLFFIKYGVISYAKHSGKIQQTIVEANIEERYLPETIKSLMAHSMGNRGCDIATHILVNKYLGVSQLKALKRYLYQLAWQGVIWLRFNQDSCFTIISTHIAMRFNAKREPLYGFQAASRYLFNKSLSELTLEQSAEIVSLIKVPNYFISHAEAREKNAQRLLERYVKST